MSQKFKLAAVDTKKEGEELAFPSHLSFHMGNSKSMV
jgi:hypothetical protein